MSQPCHDMPRGGGGGHAPRPPICGHAKHKLTNEQARLGAMLRRRHKTLYPE